MILSYLMIVIAERFYFHRRSQQPGEYIAQYVAALRRLVIHCEFSEYLEDALRDHFVCGIRSESIQCSLLTEKDLSFARATELAQGMEAAKKNAHSFKGTEVPIQKIRQSATPSGTACRQNPAISGNPCYIGVARRIIQQQIVALKMLCVIITKRRVIWQKFVVIDLHNS